MGKFQTFSLLALLPLGLGRAVCAAKSTTVPLRVHYEALIEVGRLWQYDFKSTVASGGNFN